MDNLRTQYGNKCQDCGRDQKQAKSLHRNGLEFAHVKPTKLNGRGRGRSNRYHDIKNNPDHYKLMCKPCHIKFDTKKASNLPEDPPF